MKELERSHLESLPRATIYLDDIEAIFDALGKVSDDRKIIVETDSFKREYSHPDQLAGLRYRKLEWLEIASSRPYIYVRFRPSRIDVSAGDSQPATIGVFTSIKQTVLARERRLSTILNSPLLLFGLSLLATIVVTVIVERFTESVWGYVAIALIVLLVGIPLGYYTYWSTMKQYAIVHFERESERPSYFQRNRDQLVTGGTIAVIGAIVGSLLTIAVTKLVGGD